MKLDQFMPNVLLTLSEQELIIAHGQLHSYFQRMLNGDKFNRESLVNSHLFVFDEMKSRDLKHKIVDELDEEMMNFNKINISLAAGDSEEEEILMLSLSDEDFLKAMTSPSEWSEEEFIKPRGMPGIYLTPPHGQLLADGKKTLIIKSVKFTKYTGTPIIVVSGKLAYGEILLKPPIEINLEEFIDLQDKHRITDTEFNHWWKGKTKLYAYDFSIQKIYDPPVKVEIPPGIQTFIRSIQIKKRISQELDKALHEIKDMVIVPDFVSISGSTVLDTPSNDIDLIWRAKFEDEDKLVLQLREMLMKFTRLFPGELQKQLHHVDSPAGSAWHFKPIADLVLRFKDKPIVELENDSYAYHKIGKQAVDQIDKVRKDIKCWVACYPKDKTWLNKLQDELGLKVDDQSGADSLHLTLAVFNSFQDIEEIASIIAEANIEKFVCGPVILDAFGDEAQVVVLRGTVPEAIYEFANKLHSMKSAITDHEFSPHITLGETDKAENLVQDFAGIQVEFGAPVFMISIPESIDKADKDFKIKLMEPFKPVKSASGYHLNEFTANQDEDLMFDTWARGYLE